MKFGIISFIITSLFAFPTSFGENQTDANIYSCPEIYSWNQNDKPKVITSNGSELIFDSPVQLCSSDNYADNLAVDAVDEVAYKEMKEYLHANFSSTYPVYIPYVLHIVDTDVDFDAKYAGFVEDRFNTYNIPIVLWREQTINYDNPINYQNAVVPNRLNIFLEEDVGQLWNGTYIVLNNTFTNTNGWGLVHELAHAIGLKHIWGSFANYSGESVTRNPNDPCYNCETEGDEVCDTPAAYNAAWGDDVPSIGGPITNFVGDCDDYLCDDPCTISYTQTFYDNCGAAIQNSNTVFFNIMNYGSRQCSQRFTYGQVSRIWNIGLPNLLSNLNIDLCLPIVQGFYLNCRNSLTLSQGENFERMTTKQTLNLSNEDLNSGRKSFYNSEDINVMPGFTATSSSNKYDDTILSASDPCSCTN